MLFELLKQKLFYALFWKKVWFFFFSATTVPGTGSYHQPQHISNDCRIDLALTSGPGGKTGMALSVFLREGEGGGLWGDWVWAGDTWGLVGSCDCLCKERALNHETGSWTEGQRSPWGSPTWALGQVGWDAALNPAQGLCVSPSPAVSNPGTQEGLRHFIYKI